MLVTQFYLGLFPFFKEKPPELLHFFLLAIFFLRFHKDCGLSLEYFCKVGG